MKQGDEGGRWDEIGSYDGDQKEEMHYGRKVSRVNDSG